MKHIGKSTTIILKTLIALQLFIFTATAAEPVIHEDLPGPLSLNGEWRFKLAGNSGEARAYREFFMEDFDASGFDGIKVPSHWALEGFEEPVYINGTEAEGFYRHTFSVPESTEGLRAILHFAGVWISAEVWLNGENLGRHDSGFTAFGFDISNELKPGGENVLAVRVRQQIPANLYKFDANDDWGLAGIYRDVWIEFTPAHLYIGNVEAVTDLDDAFEHADLNLRVFVARNERDHYIAPSDPFDVQATLFSMEGAEIGELTQSITVAGAHNGRDTHLSMKVRNPRLWTAETPELYRLRVEIVRSGQTVHQWEDSIGFREISADGGVLRVNGQIVKLRGVASHDLHPRVGRATAREHWLQDIRLMKEANINAVRLAHYPHAEGFIRLCDEMGLYVLDEIPLGFGGDRMSDPIFAGGMLLRIHETIHRDRNRPSVIIWNFGNEDGLSYLHTVGLRVIKGIDPTRPVLLPFRAEPELPPEVDILAPHYWLAEDYDKIAASATRSVVTTEYTHAMGERGLGELEHRWNALTSHPSGAGGMIWLWADQGLYRPVNGRPVFDPMSDKDSYTREGGELVRHSDAGENAIYDAHGNYGTDGIVNPDRSLTRDYAEAKAVYAPVRVLTERVELRPGQDRVRLPVHNGYDFTNLSEVTFEWALFRDGNPLDKGSLQLEAAPHVTSELEVPVGQVTGEGIHYIEVAILRPGGSSMATQSVRLEGAGASPEASRPELPVSLKETEELVTVQVGEVALQFSKSSGEIDAITRSGEALAGASNLVVWRKSTFNERNRYDRRENQHDWDTFMQGLDGSAESWEVEKRGDEVVIRARTRYVLDDLNSVTADYIYTIFPTGEMEVALEVVPEMDIPELPEVGIVLDIPQSLDGLAWLGEGPEDSLPGKTAATRFGLWSAGAGSETALGTKSGLDWAELRYSDGAAVRILYPDGIRLESAGDAFQFRILTHLGGAWTKNGPPEHSEWHLDLERHEAFRGSFRIQF